MFLQKLFSKKGFPKRIVCVFIIFVLMTFLSGLTTYSAEANFQVAVSDCCTGGECCTDNDCSCPNCTAHGNDTLSDGGFNEVTVEDDPLPLLSGKTNDFFMFAPMGVPTWSVFNLALTSAGILLSMLMIFRALLQKKQEFDEIDEAAYKIMTDNSTRDDEMLVFIENDERFTKRRRLFALGVKYVFSFSALILLFLTQNFKGIPALFDVWSPTHAALFAGIVISGSFVFKKLERSCPGHA